MSRLQKQPESKNAQTAVINWLNAGETEAFVRVLVEDAKSVVEVLGEFDTLKAFFRAMKEGKLPKNFGERFDRLNETLQGFPHVPQVHPNFFYEAEPIWWMAFKDAPPIEHLQKVRCVIQLIENGTLKYVSRCESCETWYFARQANQRFCSQHCRWKASAQSPEFKEKRRKAARDRYRRQVPWKVRSRLRR